MNISIRVGEFKQSLYTTQGLMKVDREVKFILDNLYKHWIRQYCYYGRQAKNANQRKI